MLLKCSSGTSVEQKSLHLHDKLALLQLMPPTLGSMVWLSTCWPCAWQSAAANAAGKVQTVPQYDSAARLTCTPDSSGFAWQWRGQKDTSFTALSGPGPSVISMCRPAMRAHSGW